MSKKEYEVKWTIDIEADNEHDAAQEALEIMQDENSIATIFEIRPKDSKGKYISIDLCNETPCVFVSVWDNGTVLRSRAVYYKRTDTFDVLQTYDVEGLDGLENEYIEFKDGETVDVCKECHEGLMRTVMVESIGKQLNEQQKCSVCEEDVI